MPSLTDFVKGGILKVCGLKCAVMIIIQVYLPVVPGCRNNLFLWGDWEISNFNALINLIVHPGMMQRYRHIISLFISISMACGGYAQSPGDFKFENYTPAHGLPSDYIENITQDKYGFIWLGTHNGLTRFDGMKFINYEHVLGDTESLPENDARHIVADSSGRVWVACRKGLFYFDYSTDRFIQLKTAATGELIHWALLPVIDNNKQLWFYSDIGICRMDCRTLRAVKINMPGFNQFTYAAIGLFSTGSGKIWATTGNRLYYFDDINGAFQKQEIRNNDQLVLVYGVQSLYEESPQKLWIGSFNGLYLLNTTSQLISKYSITENKTVINSFYISRLGSCPKMTGDSILWCCTQWDGLLLFNMHSRQFQKTLLFNIHDENSLGGSYCYTIFQDRDGILWISHINGLSKLDWHNQQIRTHRIREMMDENKMYPIRKMLPVLNSDSLFWIVTWGNGVLQYDKEGNHTVKNYLPQSLKNKSSFAHFNYDALYDDDWKLWVATELGLSYLDKSRNQFLNLELVPGKVTLENTVLRLLKDDQHRLWLGTESGVWKYDIRNEKFSKIKAWDG